MSVTTFNADFSAVNAEFCSILEANKQLGETISLCEKKGGELNFKLIGDVFLPSGILQQRINAFVNGRPHSIIAVQLQQEVHNTHAQVLQFKRLESRCHDLTNELHPDLIEEMFRKYMSSHDYESIAACACLNKYWNQVIKILWDKVNVQQLYPQLIIIDAKLQGVEVDDEPPINKLSLLKGARDLIPHVEGNEGLTLLTMPRDMTLHKLVQIAAEKGMIVDFGRNKAQILQSQGDVPVEHTYRVLLSNNVALGSRNLDVIAQQTLVEGINCELMTVQENVALCVFIYAHLDKCVFRASVGNTLSTYGRTCTKVDNWHLVVGSSAPARLFVVDIYFNFEINGAGFRWKF